MNVKAVAAVLLASAACGAPNVNAFHVMVKSADGTYPLPIELLDRSNEVTAVDALSGVESNGNDLAIQIDASNSKAVVVSWLGGACDNDASFSVWKADTGYGLIMETHRNVNFRGGCPALGIWRAIRITMSDP